MKKKILIAVLCTMFIFTLTACNKNSSTTNENEAVKEIEPISQAELTKEAEAMLPIFHAMNSFFFEIKTIPNWGDVSSLEYDPEDAMQYWSSLARVASMCGPLYDEAVFTFEDEYNKVNAKLMREFAYICFADNTDLDSVPIPDSVDATVYYDSSWDAYFVLAGDAGAVGTIITSFTDNKDGTYVAEVDYVDVSDNNSVMQHFTYELVDNEIADMSMFPYSIKNIIIK